MVTGFFIIPIFKTVKAVVRHKHELKNVLSASGIEYDGDLFYVVGDDSPYLYILNKEFKLLKQEKLFDAEVKDSGRIRKKLKPDFEGLTFAHWSGKKKLLKFGSGSKKLREKLLVSDPTNGKTEIYSLEQFYYRLRWLSKLHEEDFNIEAAVSYNEMLYLFNRGSNTVFRLGQYSFFEFIVGQQTQMPQVDFIHCTLPELDNVQAGFSGACVYEDKIFFSASLERTSNWIDDGQVLGSYVGMLETSEFKDCQPACILIEENNETFLGKVESLVITGTTGNAFHVIAVTDEDNGNSVLIEIELSA